MAEKRNVEVFSAGCPLCHGAVSMVERIACASCEVQVHDMRTPAAMARAAELGVKTVPAVAVDGVLADCCAGRGPDEASLRAAGVGNPVL
ncbi:MAG: thioredoxin family protein [bacterium]|jgi:glutaredoxin